MPLFIFHAFIFLTDWSLNIILNLFDLTLKDFNRILVYQHVAVLLVGGCFYAYGILRGNAGSVLDDYVQ